MGCILAPPGRDTLFQGFIEIKGTLLGTPNREPQEYSRNIMEYKDPDRYIDIIYLLYSWGSLFGVPSRVPLEMAWAHVRRFTRLLPVWFSWLLDALDPIKCLFGSFPKEGDPNTDPQIL